MTDNTLLHTFTLDAEDFRLVRLSDGALVLEVSVRTTLPDDGPQWRKVPEERVARELILRRLPKPDETGRLALSFGGVDSVWFKPEAAKEVLGYKPPPHHTGWVADPAIALRGHNQWLGDLRERIVRPHPEDPNRAWKEHEYMQALLWILYGLTPDADPKLWDVAF